MKPTSKPMDAYAALLKLPFELEDWDVGGGYSAMRTGNRYDERGMEVLKAHPHGLRFIDLTDVYIQKWEIGEDGQAKPRDQWLNAPYELVMIFKRPPVGPLVGFQGPVQWLVPPPHPPTLAR